MTLREDFRLQARHCAALGSLFMAQLMLLFADRLTPGDPVSDALFDWPGDRSASGASVPLRLAGGLHMLVLCNKVADLTSVYPPNTPSDDALWTEVRSALRGHVKFLLDFIKLPPQTNEIRRSSVMIAASHLLADRFGLPMVVSELGASGGLNLLFDRYQLIVGKARFGAGNPITTLAPDWSGPLPPNTRFEVINKAGVDLSPLDPTKDKDHLRLLAYSWQDQPDRIERLNRAAPHQTTQVEQDYVADWLPRRLTYHPKGHLHLVYNTVAWQYFPSQVQQFCTKALEHSGARATTSSPLAHLAMEADEKSEGAAITLQIWPNGEKYNLGRVDFHGRWINWSKDTILT